MLNYEVIGNLGSDAKVEEANGRKFVSFNVGHNDRWSDESGQVYEQTIWISCAMNGDGGKLLPFLKKGKAVFVRGRGSVRVYSSPKERRMVAGLNVSVDRLELLGGTSDEVPRRLYNDDGEEILVSKAYFISQAQAEALGVKKMNQQAILHARDGRDFNVDYPCWVTPAKSQEPAAEQTTSEDGQSKIF